MRILVVEDNPKTAATIQRTLLEQGYVVDIAGTGYDAEARMDQGEYDLVVLDVMLPDRDGVDLCRSLRRREIRTPVLMLTALSATQDKVAGLDAGADDYLVKPFEFEELVARVRALLRRGQATESTRLRYGDLELDLARRTATRGGAPIRLSSKEFSLLEFLIRNPNRVLSRTTLGQRVWDLNEEPTSNVIDVYISMLRRKVDRGFDKPLIHTVIGTGYLFGMPEEAEVPARC